jgi:hypothetical protein
LQSEPRRGRNDGVDRSTVGTQEVDYLAAARLCIHLRSLPFRVYIDGFFIYIRFQLPSVTRRPARKSSAKSRLERLHRVQRRADRRLALSLLRQGRANARSRGPHRPRRKLLRCLQGHHPACWQSRPGRSTLRALRGISAASSGAMKATRRKNSLSSWALRS